MTETGHPSPSPDFLTPAEVADVLRTTPVNILRLCREGKLPATKPLGTWLISRADLMAHIEANRNTDAAA